MAVMVHHAKAYSEIMDGNEVLERWTFAPHLIGTPTQGVIREQIDQIADRKYRARSKSPTELTEIGEQYVIPGCEKKATPGNPQGSLW